MFILYISKLEGKPWIGPTYSVPKQVEAQREYDTVLWYNLCNDGISEGKDIIKGWRKLDYYLDLSTHPDGKIKLLPQPFCHPDLIVIEQGYPYARDAIRNEIMAMGIPYIVIPRGELTKAAQRKKRLKKIVGNLLFNYPKFMNRALAIQFLTEQEKKETSKRWNRCRIVVPNGTNIPQSIIRQRTVKSIRCVFIGRIEPYQKGLDILIDAIAQIKDEIRQAQIMIEVYGSDYEHKREDLKCTVEKEGLNGIITFHDAIYGEEKSQILLNSDVFLIPSRFEGHPTGLLEALSYGLPCIATTGCNMRKEIDEADAGWTADNDAISIREAFLRMICDIPLLHRKSENAKRLAMQYDWICIAEKTHSIYVDLLRKIKK